MMGMGSVDMRELVKLQENLKKLEDEAKRQQFCEASAKKLAARLLTYVIKRTPVGNYSYEVTATAKRDGKKHKKGEQYTKRINPSGRKGGVLHRGWEPAMEVSMNWWKMISVFLKSCLTMISDQSKKIWESTVSARFPIIRPSIKRI